MLEDSLQSGSSTDMGREGWKELQQFTTVLLYIFTKTINCIPEDCHKQFPWLPEMFFMYMTKHNLCLFVCKSLADNHFNKAHKGHIWCTKASAYMENSESPVDVSGLLFVVSSTHPVCYNDYNPTCSFSSLT